MYPTTEASAIFAASRVEQTPQVVVPPNCIPPTHPDCSWNTTGVDDIFFIPDIEWFTVRRTFLENSKCAFGCVQLYIDHSMNAPRLGYTRNAIDMSGALLDSNGIEVDPCCELLKHPFSPIPPAET